MFSISANIGSSFETHAIADCSAIKLESHIVTVLLHKKYGTAMAVDSFFQQNINQYVLNLAVSTLFKSNSDRTQLTTSVYL